MTSGFPNHTHHPELGELSDPRAFNTPIFLGESRLSANEIGKCLEQLHRMLVIRRTEEIIAELVVQGTVKCPCHLGIGQEAVAVGVSAALNSDDRILGNHRSHPHFLALGGRVVDLLSRVLGKKSGCSRGMGGSMHLIAEQLGFIGSVPIVGATIPIACGAALALKLSKSNNVAVSYFGDGASEEGVFHESLNLASAFRLPILFVCENNLYSSHLDIKFRQPSDRIARFAEAHRIEARTIDGNDVREVAKIATELVASARSGGGPAFIEAVTYRWRGHVGPDENQDVGLRRSAEDLAAWKKRDPIDRFARTLISGGYLAMEDYSGMRQAVDDLVLSARDEALAAPYPESEALLRCVFDEKGV